MDPRGRAAATARFRAAPDFRTEAEYRSNFAYRVHAPALQCISEVELDECPASRLPASAPRSLAGTRGDHVWLDVSRWNRTAARIRDSGSHRRKSVSAAWAPNVT